MRRREFIQTATFLGAAAGSALAEQQNELERSSTQDAMALHRSALIVDALDASTTDEKHLERLKAGGVSCRVGGWGNLPDVQAFANAYNFLDAHKDRIVPCTTVREIREAHQQGKIAQVFNWQAANVLGHMPGEPPPTALRAFYQLGLRTCGIAYNVANIFGGGCLEPQIGLTRAGRRLVEEIHKLRIQLDVGGHTGEQASLDALAMSSGVPVSCSHTNLAALNDNPRCTSDRVLAAIARTGGVIGITAFNDFIARSRRDVNVRRTPQVGLEKYLDQFDYLRKLVGVDHIGLGTDNVEGRVLSGNRMVSPPEAYSEQPWLYVKGYETIAQLPNVTRGLIQRGWSNEDIRKILGQNWLRVWEKIWGA